MAKNRNLTAENHNNGQLNYTEWNNNLTFNEDTNADTSANNNDTVGTTAIGGNLMEGMAELIIQPKVARIGTGSGSSDNTLDRDKDKTNSGKEVAEDENQA